MQGVKGQNGKEATGRRLKWPMVSPPIVRRTSLKPTNTVNTHRLLKSVQAITSKVHNKNNNHNQQASEVTGRSLCPRCWPRAQQQGHWSEYQYFNTSNTSKMFLIIKPVGVRQLCCQPERRRWQKPFLFSVKQPERVTSNKSDTSPSWKKDDKQSTPRKLLTIISYEYIQIGTRVSLSVTSSDFQHHREVLVCLLVCLLVSTPFIFQPHLRSWIVKSQST